jgi:hypothetical protein
MRTRGVFEDGTTAIAGGWRSAAAWLGVLVLACGRPDDGPGSSSPASPRPEAAPGVASGWARDPATDECSYYANRDAAPDGWLRFDSDLECRCSIESCPSTIEEAEQRLCAVTSPPANVQRFVGCNLVAVADYSGTEWWAFEQSGDSATPAPRLVGGAKRSDASSFDAGSTSSWWSAGVDPAHCDYDAASSVCHLCGEDPFAGDAPCQ